jgi:hypothetical protein
MKKNGLVVGSGGNLSSRAGAAEKFTPGVYSLKSNPINVNSNRSEVRDLGMGTSRGGDKLGNMQGKRK